MCALLTHIKTLVLGVQAKPTTCTNTPARKRRVAAAQIGTKVVIEFVNDPTIFSKEELDEAIENANSYAPLQEIKLCESCDVIDPPLIEYVPTADATVAKDAITVDYSQMWWGASATEPAAVSRARRAEGEADLSDKQLAEMHEQLSAALLDLTIVLKANDNTDPSESAESVKVSTYYSASDLSMYWDSSTGIATVVFTSPATTTVPPAMQVENYFVHRVAEAFAVAQAAGGADVIITGLSAEAGAAAAVGSSVTAASADAKLVLPWCTGNDGSNRSPASSASPPVAALQGKTKKKKREVVQKINQRTRLIYFK